MRGVTNIQMIYIWTTVKARAVSSDLGINQMSIRYFLGNESTKSGNLYNRIDFICVEVRSSFSGLELMRIISEVEHLPESCLHQ